MNKLMREFLVKGFHWLKGKMNENIGKYKI
jgi:hypothetical protein